MVSNDKGKQAQITSYFDPAAARKLKALSANTGIPQSALLREALDDLLQKYSGAVRRHSK